MPAGLFTAPFDMQEDTNGEGQSREKVLVTGSVERLVKLLRVALPTPHSSATQTNTGQDSGGAIPEPRT